MFKFLKFSKTFRAPLYPYNFSSYKNIDFQDFIPIVKDSKDSKKYEFKLLIEADPGRSFRFEMPLSNTIENIFEKMSENFKFRSYKAISVDKAELSPKTSLENLKNSNFYILGDENYLFKIIDGAMESDLKSNSNGIIRYCDELDISYLQKKIIINYLNRLDILNQMKFGNKIFTDDGQPNNQLIEKEAFIQNLIEALPSNRSNFGVNEEDLMMKYLNLKEEVARLSNEKNYLETAAHKSAKRKMILGLFALFGQFGFVGYGTYVVFSWDIIEPMVYFIGLGASIILGLQYFKLNDQYSNSSFQEYLKKRELVKLSNKMGVNLALLDERKQQLHEIEKLLKTNLLLNL